MTKGYRRVLDHLQNRVKDLPLTFSNWLCLNYDDIVIPRFGSHRMSQRKNHDLNSKTVRNMMTWSHCHFLNILQYVATKYNIKYVLICSEEYTSKTCGGCESINAKLAGNKVFTYARNIGPKWLSSPSPSSSLSASCSK